MSRHTCLRCQPGAAYFQPDNSHGITKAPGVSPEQLTFSLPVAEGGTKAPGVSLEQLTFNLPVAEGGTKAPGVSLEQLTFSLLHHRWMMLVGRK